jgi:hypothetical protein
MTFAAQSPERVEQLTHEGASAGHDRADEHHLARQALEVLLLHRFAPYNVLHFSLDVFDPFDVNAHRHCLRVDDIAENFHYSGRKKRLSLGHRNTEIGAHFEPQLHLGQGRIVVVAAAKEVIDVTGEGPE